MNARHLFIAATMFGILSMSASSFGQNGGAGTTAPANSVQTIPADELDTFLAQAEGPQVQPVQPPARVVAPKNSGELASGFATPGGMPQAAGATTGGGAPPPPPSQQDEFRRAYERQYEQKIAQLEAQRKFLDDQVKQSQGRLETLQQQHAQPARPPLPAEAVLRVFELKFAKAQDAAEKIAKIIGDSELRIAIDEPRNVLLVAANPTNSVVVDQLIQAIDSPRPDAGGERPDTLQVRLMWIANDTDVGIDPRTVGTNPQVLEALEKLGFANPKIVCKHIASVIKERGKPSQFRFEVPVLFDGNVVDFRSEGTLSGDGWYQLQLDSSVNSRDQNGNPRSWAMSGSIAMPLQHYVILGTTNLVVPAAAGGMQSFPAALVVYIESANRIADDNAVAPLQMQPLGDGFRGGRGGRGRGGRGG